MQDDYDLVDGRYITTEELMGYLDDAAEEPHCSDDLTALLYSAVLRLHVLTVGYRFTGAGLIVTNAMWFSWWMGWI